MFSVIFEVLPGQDSKDEYLELAKHLKPILETMHGCIDNERFESRLRSGWILSHSTWRDENSYAGARKASTTPSRKGGALSFSTTTICVSAS